MQDIDVLTGIRKAHNESREASNITDNESPKMKTGKGTFQGYNGVATAYTKHQIVVDASAFGRGLEQHTLPLVLKQIED
jgi:hypothetical protein